jgi:hypothetical protein
MPEFKVSGRMKVKTLRDQFRKAYGSELSVINPENDGWYVGDDVTLASCRPAGKRAKPGEINVRGNMLVGNFEKEMKEEADRELDIATYNLMNKKKKSRTTNLYVMIDHHTGHYKIGRSNSPTKREATLLSQKSSIELLFFFPGTINQEKMLHEIFKDKWVRGEWFDLTNNDLMLLKKIGGLL